MVERRGLRLLLALLRSRSSRRSAGAGTWRWRAALLRHFRSQNAQRLGACRIEVDPSVGQNLRGDAFLFSEEPQQQMLGSDVAVVELASFAHCELEDFLRPRCIWKVGPAGLASFALLDRLFDLLLNLFELDIQILQNGCGDTLAFANQSEEYVLRPHVFVVETSR